MTSTPVPHCRNLSVQINRHRRRAAFVDQARFEMGGDDVPVPVNVGIQLRSGRPVACIQPSADIARDDLNVARF